MIGMQNGLKHVETLSEPQHSTGSEVPLIHMHLDRAGHTELPRRTVRQGSHGIIFSLYQVHS